MKPSILAVLYCFLALSTTLLISNFENSLIELTHTYYKGIKYEIKPLVSNYSTLLDFLVLNPLLIYFVIRAYKETKLLNIKYNWSSTPLYHLVGQVVLIASICFMFMWFYFSEFLNGTYFDAIVHPNLEGEVLITKTGWTVFFWTFLCMFTALFFSIRQVSYINNLLHLKKTDIEYKPNDVDSVGGLSHLVKPLLSYFYGTLVMLMIFIVFSIYDHDLKIEESNRLYGFIVFLLISAPTLLIPLHHLHKLMVEHRLSYIRRIKKAIDRKINDLLQVSENEAQLDIESQLKVFEYIKELQSLESTFPDWPIRRIEISIPILSFILSAVKIVSDLI